MARPKVLVTGASGFLGTNLLDELVKLKYETLAISRSKKKVIALLSTVYRTI